MTHPAGPRVTLAPADELARLRATVADLAAAAEALAALPNPWAPPALLATVRALAGDMRAQDAGLRHATVRMRVADLGLGEG